MARDYLGFSSHRKFDSQGRPLKDIITGKPNKLYDEGWERTFGKNKEREAEETALKKLKEER